MAAAAVGVTATTASVVLVKEKESSQIRRSRISQLPAEWAQRARDQLGEDIYQMDRQIRQLRAKLKVPKKLLEQKKKAKRSSENKDSSNSEEEESVATCPMYCCNLPYPWDVTCLEPDKVDDAFFIAFLRARKYDIDKTVKLIRRYCDMRRRYPDVCKFAAPSRHLRFHQSQAITLLEDRRCLDSVVVLGKIDHFQLPEVTAMHAVRQYYSLLEAVAADPLTQVAGVYILLDLAGFGFRHARLISPSFVRTTVSLTQDSFPLRCKGVHVVNQPFGFDALYNVFKPFLNEKLRKRVRIHGDNWNSLHQYLPREILPRMYGGVKPGLDSAPSLRRLSEAEEAMMCLFPCFFD